MSNDEVISLKPGDKLKCILGTKTLKVDEIYTFKGYKYAFYSEDDDDPIILINEHDIYFGAQCFNKFLFD
jgi:hypothetical protein